MMQSAARTNTQRSRRSTFQSTFRDGRPRPSHLTLVRPASEPKNLTFTITIPAERGPAFRAAIIDASNRVGQRMIHMDNYPREQALVNASLALGALRAVVCAQVPKDDPNYWPRWVQHQRAVEAEAKDSGKAEQGDKQDEKLDESSTDSDDESAIADEGDDEGERE